MHHSIISKELSFIILMSRFALDEDFCDEIIIPDLDVQYLENLINQHGIRVQFYYGLTKINLDFHIELSKLRDRLKHFVFQQNLMSLVLKNTCSELAKSLTNENIEYFFWKGLSISDRFYPKSAVYRECGDIDLVVQTDDFPKVIDLLFTNGYSACNNSGKVLSAKCYTDLELGNNIEISLVKDDNPKISIDLHNSTHAIFTPINVKEEDLFVNYHHTYDIYFLDIIKMLIHHGNRESWLSLKNVTDWFMIMKSKPEGFNWDAYLPQLEKYGLLKSFCTGNLILNTFFNCNYLQTKKAVNLKSIVRFWMNPFNRYATNLSLKQKLSLLKMYFKISDNVSVSNFMLGYIKFYSISSELEITKSLNSSKKKRNHLNIFYKMLSKFIH